ncbi:MAG: PEGA domain-containing protein [Velocimicrobium sp.]
MKQKKRRKWIPLGLIIFVIIGLLSACQRDKNSTNTNEKVTLHPMVQEADVNYDTMFTGVIKSYDDKLKTVSVFDINGNMSYTFDYNSSTDIKNAYDEIITMPQITIGEIVDVCYYEASQKLTALSISKEAWTYKKVGNLVTDKTSRRMKISGHNYWYNDGLLLFSEEEPIELIDVHEKDELTVKGVGSQICSIIVTTGHGYIRLKNYSDFVGGTIEVGYGIIIPIVKDMLIVAREGDYKVNLENGELLAEKNIKLKRNEEITLDLSEYKMPESRIGYVRFDIEPYGADLSINGAIVDYSDPIKLNYGKHRIWVSMNGYDDFYGTLTIGESTPTITIRLAEGTYTVQTGDDETGEAHKSNDTTLEQVQDDEEKDDNKGEDEEKVLIDNDHIITIESPAGATLYLNGKQMGIIPISFTKEIGNHIIVLSQSGYITKSYSVEVLDDGENTVFNFPDMILMQ